jgi:hypothetical protein
MASREGQNGDDLHNVVMREMRSKENARFLRRLPTFKLPDGLPQRLTALLDDLERVEHGSARQGAYGTASGAHQ